MHYLFPERVNVNFVQIINEDAIKIKTWERGVGEVYLVEVVLVQV